MAAPGSPIGAVTEGSPEPLGVTITSTGINVAVWSLAATAVELCLFDAISESEVARLTLPGRTGPIWHGHVVGVMAGDRYGLRAHGPQDPARGLRFNPAKLLLDPYATRLDRPFALHPTLFDHGPGGGMDSAPSMPKAIVETRNPSAPRSPLSRSWGESVIYELHVKGFTRLHPDIPEPLRGTFAGLAHPAAVDHLTRLSVTAVEILPACAWVDERHLPPLGLTNYWGYNPIAYLAPDPRLAPGGWDEVRATTDTLAAAGIETIFDVVLNHSGEGDALGPTLSLRGLDNAAYYRLDPSDPAAYLNDAGTGSTLALNQAPALRLAMDSLRAWATLGGASGFRFDLATVMGRGADAFDPRSPLIAAIEQDPILRGLKLIAEPWDCGTGGYQLGAFPPAWGEWNDRFRDAVRGFWRSDGVTLGALASRLAGSQDLFAARRPSRSVNFVVAHDGFTLADLVSHQTKHNDANGEHNRDGTDNNLSWNHGVEGPAADSAVVAARLSDQRALLSTLMLARGTPMLAMGMETGQTQGGNNNAYAQDNRVSWLDWAGADKDLLDFTRRLTQARRDHPALRTDRFLTGRPGPETPYPDVTWLTPEGTPLEGWNWDDPAGKTLVMVLAEPAERAIERVVVVLHRGSQAKGVVLPEPRDGFAWSVAIDSADPARTGGALERSLDLAGRSVVLLTETAAPDRRTRGVDDATLAGLAAAAGIAPVWHGVDGRSHQVTPETQRALLAAMDLPAATNQQALESRQRLRLSGDKARQSETAPDPGHPTCHLPADLRNGARLWGLSAQLYGVRRAGDQGIGDLTTLGDLARSAAAQGASILGINPLHALFDQDRERASPYYPSDRRFLDPIHLDINAVPFAERVAESANRPMIDYPAVWREKSRRLEASFAGGRADPALRAFIAAGGERLVRFALFQAISESRPGEDWRVWPESLRNPDGLGVRAFAAEHADRVLYHQYLQWLCDRQLAGAAAQASGLSLGLCRDVAVGSAPDGAEQWAEQALVAKRVSIGAPPDPFGPQGQVWGLPPFNPHRLGEDNHGVMADLYAANMRHAGALRVDHILGMARQFWIPDGASAVDGAYVAFPFQDLLTVLARESRAARCLVIGEDLGTVPEGLRETLGDRNILSYRVLPFERDGAAFRPPAAAPRKAWACVATHDLPPLAGWWDGVEIDERLSLGLLTQIEAAAAHDSRHDDRNNLIAALVGEGLIPSDTPGDAPLNAALAAAVHAYVARSEAVLAVAQVEDLAGERAAVNLPGTDRERPNWRRRLASPLETLFDTPLTTTILAAIRRERPAKDPS